MRPFLILTVIVTLRAFAAGDSDAQAQSAMAAAAAAPDDARIAFAPDAAKKNERNEKTELYIKSFSGDADAKKKWSAMKAPARTALLADLAKESEESVARSHAIRELATLSPSEDPDGAGLAALAQVAVLEKEGALRTLARNGLVVRNDDRTAKLLVPALGHQNALVQDNAAAALNAIGGPKVFEVIIEHWKETWGPGNRANAYFGEQHSYVADYDINGDSYAPVVRTFMTGVCLDVKSLKIEGDIYYKTIRELAPQELKDLKLADNPNAWEKWVNKERAQLAADAEAKRRAARAALSEVQDE